MATFTVTNTNNSGAGSLRQEILDANALSGKDIINFGGLFNDGLAHPISLTGSGLSITDDLTIQGTNPNLLTIKDDSASRVFDITSGVTSAINGLTITNKYSGTAGGGAISNEGVFTLSNSIVTGNTANDGGGIYNTGTLTVNHSTISENTATEGGGIFNEASLTLNFSTITRNTAVDGGGIENSYSNATITTVNYGTITGNTAEHAGGIDNSGSITLNHSSITHNTASDDGGAILNSGSLSVNYSNISSNIVKVSGSPDSFSGSGGGIFNYSGSLTLNHSTINDNIALNGGGIYMYITTDFDTVNLLVSNSSISSLILHTTA
ncbi:MAG: hypothetical protein V7K27_32020 [Nostoc sp.]|uniref:hypothetical protein n=1 Tax=Nostoc sp. TaxID=1180 RepID=UPI002FFB6DE1